MRTPRLRAARHRASPFAEADMCGLAGLPPRGRPARSSRQDIWDFTVVIGLPRLHVRGALHLDFRGIINPRWKTVAKEYMPRSGPRPRSRPRRCRTPPDAASSRTCTTDCWNWSGG